MSQLGRISGPLLKKNLIRNGVDLAFETDLLYLDVNSKRIGINVADPVDITADLTVNGLIRTGTIDITSDNVNIGAINISSNTITSSSAVLNLAAGGNGLVVYQSKLLVDDIQLENNVISTTASNADLELRPNGTGSVEIFANTNITGNITATGNLDVSGDITIGGNLTIGDQTTDTVSFVASVNSNIVPTVDNLYDLGSDSANWSAIYAAELQVGNISVISNVISTIEPNTNLIISASGTGTVLVPDNNVQIDQNLTVVGTTNVADLSILGTVTHIGNVEQTGSITQTGVINVTGSIVISGDAQFNNILISGNTVATTVSNSDLSLSANGTGLVIVPTANVVINNDLTVNGIASFNSITTSNTVTANAFSTGDILISENFVTTTQSNSNLELRANGTGKILVPNNNVQLDQQLTVVGTTNTANIAIVGSVDHIGNTVQTGDFDQTGNFTLTGDLNVGNTAQFQNIRIDNNVIDTTISNSDLELLASGTGKVLVPSNNVEITQQLTVSGAASTTTLNNTGTVTSTVFTTGDISISNNTITTTVSNSDLELRASGTGRIYVPTNDVQIDQSLTVIGSTTLADTVIVGTVNHTGDVVHVGNVTQTGTYQLNGNLTVDGTVKFIDVEIDNNVITTTLSNSNLELRAAGTGKIVIPSNNVQLDQNLTVLGTTTTVNINNSGTITAATFSDGDITISGNIIQTTATNSNLQLRAAGTGFIELEQFEIQNNTIRISAADTDLVLQPNGTGIVSINSTQALKIPVGDIGQRPTAVSGMIRFNSELTRYEGFNGIAWVRLDGVEDADGNTRITAELTPGANDNTIRFFTNGTQVADLNSTRFNVTNLTSGNINVTGSVISTTGLNQNLNLTPNGTGSVRTGNFSFKDSTITNIVTNSVTNINHTGNGYFKINSTGGFVIPTGLTAQRPPLFAVGMIRYNTDPGNFRVEIWDGANWVNAGQGAGGGVSIAEAEDIGIVSAIIFG